MTIDRRDVTVVVPAHNVERYLPACLDSLLAQSVWPDCRVIVVDDGSTDATGAFADAYAARHSSITVVHQPNAGPGAGAARNRGLDLADTEFVLFLDGDDELTERAVELLRTGLLHQRLNLAVGATEQFPEPRSWLWSHYFVPGTAARIPIEGLPLLAHDARTCNKLYRTSWLRALGLRFAEGIHHQDTVVNVPAMLLTERLFVVGDVVHRYRKRAEGGSVMDGHFSRVDNYWDHLQVIESLHAMRPGFSPAREPLMQAFIARSFQGFSWRAPSVVPAHRLEEFFTRASAVIRTLQPAIITTATRHPGERVAYVAMLEGDYVSFENLGRLRRTIVAHQGDLHVGVPASPAHLPLLRLGATRALVTEVGSDAAGVRLRIRLRIRGFARPGPALPRTTLRAMAGGAEAFGVAVAWTAEDGRESLGEVFLPWPLIGDGGAYELRLHFRTATGAAARWLRLPGDGPAERLGPRRGTYAELGLTDGHEGRAVLTIEPTLRLRAQRLLGRVRRAVPRPDR
ncbi:glycosyltransferase family 2 protein [Micropruina sp.]|uniref:glycosyltransferase family 2 protein n=1 Tax=Micropruina sp. TaxID=2737536 RepID=UPI0039E62E54